MRVPMPMTPVVNGRRRKKRIAATFTAAHLCGLPLDEGAEVVVELKNPLKEPLLPERDHLFPVPNQPDPDLSEEPIFSIYSRGKEGRLIVPLSSIHRMELFREEELVSGSVETAGNSLLERLAACRLAHSLDAVAGYLAISRDGLDAQDIILACVNPRQLRQAGQAAKYYKEHIRPLER